MKLYRTKRGAVLQFEDSFRFLSSEDDWDTLVNRDDLRSHLLGASGESQPSEEASLAVSEEL